MSICVIIPSQGPQVLPANFTSIVILLFFGSILSLCHACKIQSVLSLAKSPICMQNNVRLCSTRVKRLFIIEQIHHLRREQLTTSMTVFLYKVDPLTYMYDVTSNPTIYCKNVDLLPHGKEVELQFKKFCYNSYLNL